MIRSYISFTRNCEVIFKLERFFYLSGRFFELGYPIGPFFGASSSSLLGSFFSLRTIGELNPKD